MDPAEWQAHEDAYEIKEARRLVVQFNLSGARKPDKSGYTIADFLPAHLAVEFTPPKLSEEEVMARFRLAGFDYTEGKPTA